MPAMFTLTPLVTYTSSGTQSVEEAIDVGQYKSVVIQVRKPTLADGGTLYIEHGMEKREGYFVNISSSDTTTSPARTGRSSPTRILRAICDFVST